MKRKHTKTLELLFHRPVSGNIKWKDLEALLLSLGAETVEREGSRLEIYLFGVVKVFHRPHPSPDTDKGAATSIRKWLEANGVTPMNTMIINGYRATISYDEEIDMFRGEFIRLNGGADFYAADIPSLRQEGAISLKVFLDACQTRGIEPVKSKRHLSPHRTVVTPRAKQMRT